MLDFWPFFVNFGAFLWFFGQINATRIVLSRKFWSAENFGLGGQNFWNIGPPWTEIFENFGPIVEKWSTHLLIASDVCQRINRKMIDDQPHFVR